MAEYYLFDLDGTLTDPGLGITNSVMHALRRSGIEPPERSELYKFIGPPLTDSFMEFYGFTEEQAEKGVEYYREYFADKGIFENEVYEGIPEALAELKRRGKKLALATSKPQEFARRILEHFDLIQYFDLVCGASMDGKIGRKAQVVELALEGLGVQDKSQALMVGDRRHDVEGAHENGIACVGVAFGYGSIEELTRAGAELIITKPIEIANL